MAPCNGSSWGEGCHRNPLYQVWHGDYCQGKGHVLRIDLFKQGAFYMVARTLLRSSFNCIKTKWSVWSSSFVSHQWILLPGHFWECIKQKSHVLDPTQYSKPNLLCRCIVALILQQGVLMCLRTGPFFFHYSKCIFSQNEDEGVAQW